MKKSLTTTLILAAALLVLILWNQIYENKIRPTKDETTEKAKQLVTISQDDIHEIIIERMKNPPKENSETEPKTPPQKPEFETIHLKKTGSDWSIASPLQDRADHSTVSTMTSTLTTTKHERVVEEKPKDLETFGLKTPWLKVTLRKDASGKPEILLMGKDTPTGYSCYAKLEAAETVYRVPKSLRTNLDKDTQAIRNKEIVTLLRPDVSEVEIQTPKENMVVKKDDKDNWTLAREGLPVENNEWTKTLGAILEVKATDFVSEDGKELARFGLHKPEVKIWLRSAKSQIRTGVWIGRTKEKDKEKVFVKREDRPVIFEVDKDILNKTLQPSSTYQSLRLAQFNRFDVKRIKFERKTETLEILKEASGWTLPANPKIKIDTGKVDTFLANLQDAKISKYLPPKQKSGIGEPELTLRLYEMKDNKEAEKLSLKFGNRKGKEISGERSDLTTAFLLKLDEFNKVGLTEKDFEQIEPKKEEKKEAEKDTKSSHS